MSTNRTLPALPVHFIRAQEELIGFCDSARSSPWLAVDTEFMRERTYFPKLCLVQIGIPNEIALIDCLELKDLTPLWSLLHHEKIEKVFHAADQDLEVIYHLSGAVPQPLFDTQLAASLLGYGDQIGYSVLVGKLLNVHLSKTHSRTDWAKRPLSDKQLKYAADDVRYLMPIYTKLDKQLRELGRLNWLRDEQQNLTQASRYSTPPNRAWLKVKGSSRLKGKHHQALQSLACWREQIAVQKNQPRKWILKDEVVVDLCKMMPGDLQELSELRGLARSTIENYGDSIIEALHEFHQFAPEATSPRTAKLTSEEESLMDALSAIVKLKALEQGLSPGSVTTRKELEQLIRGERALNILQGWRYKVVGQTLEQFISGKIQVVVRSGQLQLESV